MQSADELRENLAEYRSQKEQVEELLELDADNEEYKDLHQSLFEVIDLTEELLREAIPSAEASTSGLGQRAARTAEAPVAAVTQAPGISTFLPPQVAQQIRAAQQKAALGGQAPPAWAIGARCQAVWSEDGGWYSGSVTGVSAAQNFIVTFDDDGGVEEVDGTNVRQAPEEEQLYRGVHAPMRKAVADEPEAPTEMPKWLEVQPEDDAKTRVKKKKLAKSYKSKMRFQKMDTDTKNRQSSWLDFQKGKGTKKKAGFFTGKKKESMFSVPDGVNAKVGVIGSGRGASELKPKQRHEFDLGESAQE